MPYANRVAEFNSLLKALSNDEQIIYINAGKAYGITSFFEECLERFSDKRICFMIRTTSNGDKDLSALLVSEISKSVYVEDLQKLADEKWGERSGTLLSSAMKIVPYAGEVLSWITSPKSAIPIYAGNYPTLLQELFVPLFEKIGKDVSITLLIDGAQNLSEPSFELIISLASLRNVSIVLALTEHSDQAAKLKNRIRQFYSLSEITFERPHAQLVSELATLYHVHIDKDHAADLAHSEDHNIHRILDHLLSRKERVPLAESPLSKAAITILAISGFDLSQRNLCSMIENAHVFSYSLAQDLLACLSALERVGLVNVYHSEFEDMFHLRSTNHPFVQRCLSDTAEMLYFGQIVYYHFSSMTDTSMPTTVLLYNLSHTYASENTKSYAKRILIKSLMTGDKVDGRVYYDSRLEEGSLNDKLLAIVYLMRERIYKKAMRLYEGIKKHATGRDCDILYAVLLNSCRNHTAARLVFRKLIESSTDKNEMAVLYAYLIVNYIHSEDLAHARELYDGLGDNLIAAKTYGYLARNAANAFPLEQRGKMLSRAITNFENSADELGRLTACANLGKVLCQLGDYKSSIAMLKQCSEGFRKFGESNLHIVYNNLGVAAMLSGDVVEAHRSLTLAEFLSRNSMPHILISINRACLNVVGGKCSQAKQVMLDIEEDVLTHPLDRVRSKYYINRLFIEYANGNDEIDSLLTLCEQYIDRYDPQHTKQMIEYYKSLIQSGSLYKQEAWRDFYSPCYMEYWYVNPLKLISTEFVNKLTSI